MATLTQSESRLFRIHLLYKTASGYRTLPLQVFMSWLDVTWNLCAA